MENHAVTVNRAMQDRAVIHCISTLGVIGGLAALLVAVSAGLAWVRCLVVLLVAAVLFRMICERIVARAISRAILCVQGEALPP